MARAVVEHVERIADEEPGKNPAAVELGRRGGLKGGKARMASLTHEQRRQLGLKGARHGGAVVSDVHGNFIVNEGHATAKDVLALIEVIRQRARAARGIELETEVEIIGE